MQITVTIESTILEKAADAARKAQAAIPKLQSGWSDQVVEASEAIQKSVSEFCEFTQYIIATYNNAHPKTE